MGQVLYRTYRSRALDEVVGQEHITNALKTALSKGLISHAYLFTGPRGTGKTSVARILAHAINDLPYSDESIHLDIIEIDAASNRRIDEIRDLRDKVHTAPTSARYKVYIIDEVHMLTREAFNALLKTLEEPPAHVIFILATTEVHKLPETIISRTQRFSFRPIALDKVTSHLRSIANKEKLLIDDDALELIAQHGGGSFRDSISLLDQTRSLDRAVTTDDVTQLLGMAPVQLISDIVAAIEHHNAPQLIEFLTQLHSQGAAAAQIATQLGQLLRAQLIAGQSSLSHDQIISLLTKLLDVPAATDPATLLEIILLDIALAGQTSSVKPGALEQTTPDQPVAAKPVTEADTGRNATSPVQISKAQPIQKPSKGKPAEDKAESTEETHTETSSDVPKDSPKSDTTTQLKGPVPETDSEAISPQQWSEILNLLKKKRTLLTFINVAQVDFEADKVTITTGFDFHQKQLNATPNKKILADIIQQVTGRQMEIICVLGEPKPQQVSAVPAADEVAHAVSIKTDTAASDVDTQQLDSETNNTDAPFDYYVEQAEQASTRPLDAVNSIFGGGEVLGS